MKNHLKILLLFVLCLPFLSNAQVTEDRRFKRAINSYESGKFNDALNQINNIRRSSKETDSLYVVATMLGAHIQYEQYNYAQAISFTEEIIKLRPHEELNGRSHIISMQQQMGNFEGAIANSLKIKEQFPEDEIIYSNLAGLYNSAGRYADALAILYQNPNPYPLDAEYYHMAVAHYNLGTYDSAKAYIDAYLESAGSEGTLYPYLYAALIYEKAGDYERGCDYVSLARGQVMEYQIEENLAQSHPNFKKLHIYKHTLENVERIMKLQMDLCSR